MIKSKASKIRISSNSVTRNSPDPIKLTSGLITMDASFICVRHGSLTRYVKLRVAHATGMPRNVPWCMPGSLTSDFIWGRWRGKRTRHSRCMRNPQFYVSGKRPMLTPTKCLSIKGYILSCWPIINNTLMKVEDQWHVPQNCHWIIKHGLKYFVKFI